VNRADDPRGIPIIIGHRGASGYRPEHTLEAYRLAIAMGADFIEPDIVPTRDGVLIARHESRIDDTTNIVDLVARGELPDRKATKVIDGHELSGYFTEDYALAEIKLLRARERNPELRPQCAAFDDRFEIPTLAEVIELARPNPAVGIYPETKHPTYFAEEGSHFDGAPIGMDLSEMLVAELVAEQFTDPRRVYIQSFEISNLIRLRKRIMPDAGVEFPLVQLFGDTRLPSPEPASHSRPYDMTLHAREGRDMTALYGELAEFTSYGELITEPVVRYMANEYATAVGPWKDNLLLDERSRDFVRTARTLGLGVHPYTFRTEQPFLNLDDFAQEIENLLDLGITGFFTDFPDQGRIARDLWLERKLPR
jgi:glycerophosphoryl diester phosphodiesterase